MGIDLPILEFDPVREAVIEPQKCTERIDIPEHVVLCFFKDVIERLGKEGKLKQVAVIESEFCRNPVYEMQTGGRKITLVHPGIGAPFAAAVMEEVIALGGKKFIACGGAGVLDSSIAVGHILVPVSAVRDEGTSYHYLPAGRKINTDAGAVEAIRKVLDKHACKYLLSQTWTTDAVYRETVNKVNLRRAEGCLSVEMECSAFCAVAQFRNVVFGQILYGGDDVSCKDWDSRRWNDRTDIREAIFKLAVEACLEL